MHNLHRLRFKDWIRPYGVLKGGISVKNAWIEIISFLNLVIESGYVRIFRKGTSAKFARVW